jgi:hypothetical protein
MEKKPLHLMSAANRTSPSLTTRQAGAGSTIYQIPQRKYKEKFCRRLWVKEAPCLICRDRVGSDALEKPAILGLVNDGACKSIH